jgi:outer membrane protein OmpU
MKKGLLASTALVGASLLATSAYAQAPSVGSNFDVSIDGTLRFGILIWDQDDNGHNTNGFTNDSDTRGYKFQTDESEVRFRMRGTADNGLGYGFDIEIHTKTDDTINADETWMFVEGDWGRVELGDQDGAASRMFRGGEDRTSGRGGWNGDVGDVFNDGKIINDTPGHETSGDHTKIVYFTPRYAGFQLGGSWTPDESHDGGDDNRRDEDKNRGDATVSYENSFDVGLNYQNTFGDFNVLLSGIYVGADWEAASAKEDKEVWGIGGSVDYAGFGFGVGYSDLGETTVSTGSAALGADAGEWLTIGLRYTTGPWQVGGGYFYSNEDNVAGSPDSGIDAYFVGFDYNIVGGWRVEGDITFIEADNINKGTTATALDNDATVFAIASIMSF